MISEWCVTPPSATAWFKEYKVVHLPLLFQNGVWPPFCNNVVQKIQGCSSPIIISEWGVTPLLQQRGSKNTRWFISHYDFRMGCDPPLLQQGSSNKKGLFFHDPQQQQQHKLGSLLDKIKIRNKCFSLALCSGYLTPNYQPVFWYIELQYMQYTATNKCFKFG